MSSSVTYSGTQTVARKAFLIWFVTAFFYLYQFIIRVAPSVFEQDMRVFLGVDACVFGGIISFYYYGYAGMQIPAGLILDRIGVKRPLTLCCLMLASGALLFSMTHNIFLLSVARLMMGIGSAFGFLSNVKVGALWFPPKRLSLIIGFTLLFGTMGAVFAGDPLARLVSVMGWRDAMMIVASIGLVMALACWFFIEDRPIEVNDEIEQSNGNQVKAILNSVLIILKNPMTWILGSYGLLMYLPLAGFADLWGVSYLRSVYDLDRVKAGALISWFYAGVGLGSPVWPWFFTITKSYRTTMITSALLTCVLFGFLLYGMHLDYLHLVVLLFLIGAASGGQFLAFVAVAEINDSSRTATASGVHNMLCMISGVIAQPLIGFFIDRYAPSECAIAEHLYKPEAYVQGLSVISVGLVLAIISCFFMRRIR